jgi:hypothetical protein
MNPLAAHHLGVLRHRVIRPLDVLLEDETVPETARRTLRAWSEDLGSGDAAEALRLDRLGPVLTGLGTLAVALHSYRPRRGRSYVRGAPISLERVDHGGALIVALARHLAGEIAVLLHGDAGLEAVRAGLVHEQDLLRSLAGMIANEIGR